MYDLMYELRLMSSAGLKRVTSEQSFIIKPMFQDTLVQLGQQVRLLLAASQGACRGVGLGTLASDM